MKIKLSGSISEIVCFSPLFVYKTNLDKKRPGEKNLFLYLSPIFLNHTISISQICPGSYLDKLSGLP
jgi:hypothetical protein